MLNACCGGIRPGHEDTKEGGVSGLHDMSTIELPVGHVKIDPEVALRGCNARFEARFRFIEDELRAGERSVSEASMEELDAMWDLAKRSGL